MTYLLIFNPKSGKGNIQKDLPKIISFFKEKKILLDIHETVSQDDARNYLLQTKKTYDCVMVAGGDGTISTVLNGLLKLDRKPILGVLPYGSANDVSHILGIPRNIKKTLELYTHSKPAYIDAYQMNEHYFMYTAAAGLFTRISYDISRQSLNQFGQLAYYIEGIKDLTSEYNFQIEFQTKKQSFQKNVTLLLGLSANRVGGIPLLFKTTSKLDDGLFEINLFESKGFLSKLRVLSFFIRFGRKVSSDIVLKEPYFKITAPQDVKWNADGEHVCDGDIEIKVLPKILPVYMSQRAKRKLLVGGLK
jgi:diacylglycerol kinase (ATP)